MRIRLFFIMMALGCMSFGYASDRPFAQRVFDMQDSLAQVLTVDPSQMDLAPVVQLLNGDNHPVHRSVLHTLMVQMTERMSYANIYRRDGDQRQELEKQRVYHLAHVLDDMPALMRAKASDYDSLLVRIDDKTDIDANEAYFRGDLLHVLAQWVMDNQSPSVADSIAEVVATCYEQQGLPDAAFLMRMGRWERLANDYSLSLAQRVDSLEHILRYPMPQQARKILQQHLERLCRPYATLHLENVLVNRDNPVTVVVTNLDSVRLAVRHYKVDNKGQYDLSGKVLSSTVLHADWHGRDKRISKDTLSWTIHLPAGKYMLTMTAANQLQTNAFHLTSMALMQVHMAGQNTSLMVADLVTGRPVPKARIESQKNKKRAVLSAQDYTEWQYIYDYSSTSSFRESQTDAALYTNRTLYRAGQNVKVNAILWQTNNRLDKANVLANIPVEVVMQDPDGKETRHTLVTNMFGSVSTEYILAEDAKPGYYSLSISRKGNKMAYAGFQVAEYKRPSFEVTAKGTCADSMVVFHGRAVSLSGVPIRQAQVSYTLSVSSFFFRNNAQNRQIHGSCTTDDNGDFEVSDSLIHLATDRCDYLSISLNATVTAANGEMQEGHAYTRISYRPYALYMEAPQVFDIRQTPSLVIDARDAGGEHQDAVGVLQLRLRNILVLQDTFRTGQAIVLPDTLACGDYEVTAMTDVDTLQQALTLFNPATVSRLSFYQDDFCYIPTRDLTDKGIDFYVSPVEQDSYMYVFVSNEKGLLDSIHITIPKGIYHLHLPYQAKYGKAVGVSLLYVRNGHKWSRQTHFMWSQPANNLRLHLTSFRSHTTPGAVEQWTVQATDTLGKVKKNVELMASLYDAALDRIGSSNTWFLSPYFARPSYSANVNWCYVGLLSASFYPVPLGSIQPMVFNRWEGFDLTPYVPQVRLYASSVQKAAPMAVRGAAMVSNDEMAVMEDKAAGVVEESETDEMSLQAALRRDFREDPLWLPQYFMQTGKGEIALTMPDAITEWRLLLLAHTDDMQHAALDTTIQVNKVLTMMPMWPRFVRRSDTVVWSASVHNESDQPIQGTARLEIRTSDSVRVLAVQNTSMAVPAHASAAVAFEIPEQVWSDTVIATFTFVSDRYTDGEQVNIPVLPAEVSVPRDTVITTMESPVELIQKAVSEVKMPRLDCALDCALAIYIARQKHLSPVQAETKLRALQHSDGSFSWCHGMEGSEYITLAVVDMLLRMPGVMEREVKRALKWLDDKELNRYRKLVEHKQNFPISESTIHYLLLSARAGNPTAEVLQMQQVYWKELSSLALQLNNRRQARRTPFTIYGVAQLANLYLHRPGNKEAKACLGHLINYSVLREGFGRYYATDMATYAWMDYKLPTQLAVIQALMQANQSTQIYDDYIAEMLLWVLRQTQSQQWQNPVNILTAAQLVRGTRNTPIGTAWQLMLDRSADTYANGAMQIARSWRADTMRVGSTATLHLRLTTDRDMDFLKVTVPLPACMEPVQQLSGYRRLGNVWGYVAQYDDHVDIYIHHFYTGHATIDIPYHIVRAGAYVSPKASFVSNYNPTFHADAESVKCVVEY